MDMNVFACAVLVCLYVYVCACMCVYMCNVRMHACAHVSVCMCVGVYTCVCVAVYVCVQLSYMCIYTHIASAFELLKCYDLPEFVRKHVARQGLGQIDKYSGSRIFSVGLHGAQAYVL